jgi:hypothetical protein
MQLGRAVSRKTKVRSHLFVPDPDVPADQNGRQACRCGLIGEAGDARHTLPDRPAGADARELAAGESEGA